MGSQCFYSFFIGCGGGGGGGTYHLNKRICNRDDSWRSEERKKNQKRTDGYKKNAYFSETYYAQMLRVWTLAYSGNTVKLRTNKERNVDFWPRTKYSSNSNSLRWVFLLSSLGEGGGGGGGGGGPEHTTEELRRFVLSEGI